MPDLHAPPVEIGSPAVTDPTSPEERRREGRAVVPERGGEVRTVEMFDATPAVNRHEDIITAGNSTFRFLRMARILLDPRADGYAPISVQVGGDEEALFYVNRGEATVEAGGEVYPLTRGDVLYVGLGEAVTVRAEAGVADVSEFRAVQCSTKYPVQLVHHADLEGTDLAANVGTKRPMTRRTVYKLVDRNVQACRLLFGDTYGAQPGAVGSYPPHFHGPDGPHGLGENAKEEIYHFRVESTIPGDAAYVLQNCARPEERVNTYVHVFDEQAINVTPSFHDTIAPPAIRFMFTWCLGAFKEGHRDWAEVFNKPGYENEW